MKANFQPILSPVRLRRLLNDLVRQRVRFRLWPRSQRPPLDSPESGSESATLEAEYVLSGISANGDELYGAAVNETEHSKFLGWCEPSRSGKFIITLQSPVGILFVNASVSELRAQAIRLHAPLKVYEVQRRASLRVRVPDQISIRVAVEKFPKAAPGTLHEVMDLSDGGLSFAVPEPLGGLFKRDLDLGLLEFQLAGRRISCHSIVRNTRQRKLRNQLNATIIGVQFAELHPNDRSWINAWVLRQSRYIVQMMKD